MNIGKASNESGRRKQKTNNTKVCKVGYSNKKGRLSERWLNGALAGVAKIKVSKI